MEKKSRLGSDPLGWIGDSKKGGSKQGKPSKQEIPRQVKKSRAGRPRTNLREITKSSQTGTKEGWTRATFIMREDTLEKLKALAYWNRAEIKEVVDEAFSSYLKGKKIKPKPTQGEK